MIPTDVLKSRRMGFLDCISKLWGKHKNWPIHQWHLDTVDWIDRYLDIFVTRKKNRPYYTTITNVTSDDVQYLCTQPSVLHSHPITFFLFLSFSFILSFSFLGWDETIRKKLFVVGYAKHWGWGIVSIVSLWKSCTQACDGKLALDRRKSEWIWGGINIINVDYDGKYRRGFSVKTPTVS